MRVESSDLYFFLSKRFKTQIGRRRPQKRSPMGEDTQPSKFQPESPKDFSPTADARNKCPVQSTTAQVTDSERRDDETHLPGLHAPPPPGPSAPRRRLQDPLPLAAAGHRAASVLHCSRQQVTSSPALSFPLFFSTVVCARPAQCVPGCLRRAERETGMATAAAAVGPLGL